MELGRRELLALGLGASIVGRTHALGLSPTQDPLPAPDDDPWVFHDVAEIGVEGRGWPAVEHAYHRFPARARETLRPRVWELSKDSSGMFVSFATDSTSLRFEVELSKANLAMAHMPATGVSGIDLYARDEDGRWRWLHASKPSQQAYAMTVKGLRAGERQYRLYLPLYNGVESLRVGVPGGASFEGGAPREERPIVYYGTSIAHGACSSRPGMSFVNQLGRRLDVPMLNLAFSGNGKLEMAVCALIAELDAALYVLDCLPNLGPQQVTERTEPFVRALRKARPETPIVLVEDRTHPAAQFFPGRAAHNRRNHTAFRTAYEALVAGRVKGLTYVPDAPFLGEDGEGTVDGSHPSDLGMMRYADALEPILRNLL